MADDLESASLRQLLSRGWKYHHATFDLYLKLSGVLLSESAMTRVVLPEIRRLVQQERIHSDWLVVWNMTFIFPFELGME